MYLGREVENVPPQIRSSIAAISVIDGLADVLRIVLLDPLHGVDKVLMGSHDLCLSLLRMPKDVVGFPSQERDEPRYVATDLGQAIDFEAPTFRGEMDEFISNRLLKNGVHYMLTV